MTDGPWKKYQKTEAGPWQKYGGVATQSPQKQRGQLADTSLADANRRKALGAQFDAMQPPTRPEPEFPGYTAGEKVENVSAGLARGLVNLGTIPATARDFAGAAVTQTQRRFGEAAEQVGARQFGRLVQDTAPLAGQAVRGSAGRTLAAKGAVEELLPPSKDSEGFQPANPMWWAEHAAEMLPQIAATFATGGAAGAAGLGARAAIWTATLPTFGLEAQASYETITEQLEAQGMSPDEAKAAAGPYAAATGLINAALERIPAGELLTKGPIQRKLLGETAGAIAQRSARVGATGVTEGVTEVGQELVAVLAEFSATGDEKVFDGLGERLLASGTLGAGIGGAVGGVTRPVVGGSAGDAQRTTAAPAANPPTAAASQSSATTPPSTASPPESPLRRKESAKAAENQTKSRSSPNLTPKRKPDAEETKPPAPTESAEERPSHGLGRVGRQREADVGTDRGLRTREATQEAEAEAAEITRVTDESQPVLTQARRAIDIVYLSFDATKPVPNPQDLKQRLAERGFNVTVSQFETDLISGTQGNVRYRIDLQGRDSEKQAAALQAELTGADAPFRSQSEFEKRGSVEDRFTATMATVKGAPPNKGTETAALPTKYADLRKMAKEMGLDPKGTAEVLRGRIREARNAPKTDSAKSGTDTTVAQREGSAARRGQERTAREKTAASRVSASEPSPDTTKNLAVPSEKRTTQAGEGKRATLARFINTHASDGLRGFSNPDAVVDRLVKWVDKQSRTTGNMDVAIKDLIQAMETNSGEFGNIENRTAHADYRTIGRALRQANAEQRWRDSDKPAEGKQPTTKKSQPRRTGHVDLDLIAAPVRAAVKAAKWTADTITDAARWVWHSGLDTYAAARKAAIETFGDGIKAAFPRIWRQARKMFTGQYGGNRLPATARQSAKPADEKLILRFGRSIKNATPAPRSEYEAIKRAHRRKQAAKLHGIKQGASGQQAVRRSLGALKGEINKPAFEALKNKFRPSEIDALIDHAMHHKLFERRVHAGANLANQVMAIFEHGVLPDPSAVAAMEVVYGPQVAAAIAKRYGSRSLRQVFYDVWNVPKSLKASMDLSATLRQGWQLGVMRPDMATKAYGHQLKAFASEEYARDLDLAMRSDPMFDVAERAGVYLAPVGEVTSLAEKEEAFMSTYASRAVPGVRQSERAYLTHLNQLRFAMFKWQAQRMMNHGQTLEADEAAFRSVAHGINAMSGRGNLTMGNLGPILNGALFSPRYLVSRFESPVRMAAGMPMHKGARLFGAMALAANVGAVLGIAAILKAAAEAFEWDAEVILDPLDPRFGKIRVGKNTTIDITAGQGTVYRAVAQTMAGKRRVPETGVTIKSDPIMAWAYFFYNKKSPSAGVVSSLITGKRFGGKEVTPTGLAIDTLVPITFEEVYDAAQEHGAAGLWLMIPEVHGAGVNIYEPKKETPQRRPVRQRPSRPRPVPGRERPGNE